MQQQAAFKELENALVAQPMHPSQASNRR